MFIIRDSHPYQKKGLGDLYHQETLTHVISKIMQVWRETLAHVTKVMQVWRPLSSSETLTHVISKIMQDWK
jgi:hypothetical protein